MLQGVRTCPHCRGRVLPTPDEMCPACRRYKFVGAPEETPAPPASTARLPEERRGLGHGARLHWHLVGLLGLLLGLGVATFFVKMMGQPGADELGYDLEKTEACLLIADILALVAVVPAASKLRRWIGDVDPRAAGHGPWNVALLLQHSRFYFEAQGIPVSILGPHMPEDDDGEGVD